MWTKVEMNHWDELDIQKEIDMTEDKLAVPISEQPFTMRTIQALIKTPTMPKRYTNSQTGIQDAWAAVLKGQELGVAPMTAIHGIYLVNGSSSMTAQLMVALVQSRGHYLKVVIKPKEATVTAMRAVPAFVRGDPPRYVEVGEYTFSEADAKRADLLGKDNYVNYPQLMYVNRALSMACRYSFPECLAGLVHTPDEVGVTIEGDEGEIVDVLDAIAQTGTELLSDEEDSRAQSAETLQ